MNELILNPPSGNVDAWAYLQTKLSQIPNNTIVYFPERPIRCDKTLYITNKAGVAIKGEGAELWTDVQGERNRPHVVFQNCLFSGADDLVVRGANHDGWQPDVDWHDTYEGQFGIYVRGSAYVWLRGVRTTNTWSDGIYVGADFPSANISRNVLITDCVIGDTFRQGISVVGGDGVVVRRSALGRIRRSAIDLEPALNKPGWQATNIWVEANQFGDHKFSAVAGRANAAVLSDITIRRNFHVGASRGFNVNLGNLDRRTPRVWVECNRDYTAGDVNKLVFVRCDDLVVAFNTIPVQARRGSPLAILNDCRGVYGEGTNTFAPSTDKEFDYGIWSTKGKGEAPPSPALPPWAGV